MKRWILLLAACGIGQAAIVFEFSPATQPVIAGDVISVDVLLSGTVAGAPPSIGSFDIDVGYNEALLDFEDVVFGLYLGDPLAFEALADVQVTGPGVVNVAMVSLLTPDELDALQPDAFSLATLRFRAQDSGNASFQDLFGPIDDAFGDLLIGAKIPEPGTLWLIGGAALMLLWKRRRTRG